MLTVNHSRLCRPLGPFRKLHQLLLQREEQVRPLDDVHRVTQERIVLHLIRRRIQGLWACLHRHRRRRRHHREEPVFLAGQHPLLHVRRGGYGRYPGIGLPFSFKPPPAPLLQLR